MLAYLRIFTLISLIAIALVVGLVGVYFRAQIASEVRLLGAQTNIAAARHLNAEVWARYEPVLATGEVPPEFRDDMQRFVQHSQVLGARIYNAQGVLLFSTGGTISNSDFQAMAATAREGGVVVSDLVNSRDMGVADPNGPSRMLVRSFVVFGNMQGYGEFFADVNDALGRLRMANWAVTAGIIGLFLVLIAALYILYQRAESIIARQHERMLELESDVNSAQEETQQKSQFLASISHELRTPLNAIIGFSDIIKNQVSTEPRGAQFSNYINDIHSSGVHLLSLINDILDFSKAEAGKLELEIEEVNATKLASNCLRLIEPRAESAGVNLVNALPKDAFVLETDGKKFKQVLLNLVSNAVKFTPNGGKVKIAGWRDLAADAFVFQVSDTGIGIAQKDIAKAMAPFGQVDNALSRKYEGTGLGLPLTKKFVELMGGKFSIQSEINVGTTVTFTLPRLFKPSGNVIYKRA